MFGPDGMHSDALRCIWKRLDLFDKRVMLFDVLDILPDSGWFQELFDDLVEIEVCSESGYRASLYCDDTKKDLVPTHGTRSAPCPYHQQVFLDKSEQVSIADLLFGIWDYKYFAVIVIIILNI